MDWSVLVGSFIGTMVGVFGIIVAFLIWDYFDRRRIKQQTSRYKPTLDDIFESQLEGFIVEHFDRLFPDWEIYNEANALTDKPTPAGVQYQTKAGIIDILCTDANRNYIVIELKKGRAPDKVVAQIDRYIAWVEQNLVQDDQSVRGIVIAKSFNNHLNYSLSRRNEIDLWVYDWQLTFDKSAMQQKSVVAGVR